MRNSFQKECGQYQIINILTMRVSQVSMHFNGIDQKRSIALSLQSSYSRWFDCGLIWQRFA
jgi:hypothetical protein